jgi:hypothetical protein
MKPLALLAALLLACGLQAAAPFEGVITFKAANPKGKTHEFSYSVKGPKTRYDMNTPRAGLLSLIVNSASGRSLLLIEGESEARERPFHDPTVRPGDHETATRTGRKTTLLGYTCEEFTVGNLPGAVQIWATKGLAPFRHPAGGPMAQRDHRPNWEKDLADQGYFPLKLIESHSTTAAIKIEKKSLPDSLFEAPAGYKKTK